LRLLWKSKNPIKDSKDALLKKLWNIEESGATALGPACLLGVNIAGVRPRSKVILCTDGLANQGIGSLDGRSKMEYGPFYTELAEQAKLKGVTVSVMTLIGTDCNVEALSTLTEQTGGDIERVNPLDLAKNMSALVATKILAYGTLAMVCLHRGLQFKGEVADEKENRNWIVKDLGNVTSESECSFSYAFRPKNECDLTGINEIPFQVQLIYTRPDGTKCLRVATATVPVTDDRKTAEENADVTVIASHVAQKATKLAKDGDYESAQLETRAVQRFMNRNKQDNEILNEWNEKAETLDAVLRKERTSEKSSSSSMRKESRNDDVSHVISKSAKVKFSK